ncbi:amino acid ABC transporter ATP-binding protein [Lichenifustis flavocetrariae]|uniref:Arginine transport ATP-binding protein ArtP n=1 Tax=Lichenifustis flavocetrariae TaxID=2949735 RepID=A0AA42CLN3_9HYPH|nr:amino acid ABC transporter ATP-binding protein [Lichenifustis flavocetrariae]MCW6511809.1 amino acid ABC transporter ATP-binding protein [Lichenifustis flavocetrariae]
MKGRHQPLSPGVPIIELDGVRLSYGTTAVLRDIDLTIRCGERVAVIGPSGSGKSTLIRCMNGLAVPQAGAVRVFGSDLRDDGALRYCRRHSEMIFQSFNLYAQRNVLDNVTLAPMKLLGLPRRVAEAAARQHLEAMEIAELAHAYPFELSGGQRQRVALARALAKGPDILLLDEPTSALDPERVQGVLQAIERATERGITTVTVTHELGFARRQASRVVFMEAGCIVEDVPVPQCLDAPRSTRLANFLNGRLAPAFG